MSDTAGMVSGVAGRYATALFELADEAGMLDTVGADISKLSEAIAGAPALMAAFNDPSASRGDLKNAAMSLAGTMGLGEIAKNTLALMADKRRLAELPRVLAGFETLMAAKEGRVTADVTAAEPLSDAQVESLRAALSKSAGKDVHMNVEVDPTLLGGLVVKMGSTMIDASVRSKLSKLQHAMKEAS